MCFFVNTKSKTRITSSNGLSILSLLLQLTEPSSTLPPAIKSRDILGDSPTLLCAFRYSTAHINDIVFQALIADTHPFADQSYRTSNRIRLQLPPSPPACSPLSRISTSQRCVALRASSYFRYLLPLIRETIPFHASDWRLPVSRCR